MLITTHPDDCLFIGYLVEALLFNKQIGLLSELIQSDEHHNTKRPILGIIHHILSHPADRYVFGIFDNHIFKAAINKVLVGSDE